MSLILDRYYYTRTLIQRYGQTYTGIYLALFLTFIVFVIYNRKEKAERCYVVFVLVMLGMLLTPGLMTWISSIIWGFDLVIDPYMVFPVVLVSIIDVLIIIKEICAETLINNKKKLMKPSACIFLILILVEASVPLQITCSNFVLPQFRGKTETEVLEIASIIDNQTVILPSDLRSAIKVTNWNASIPYDYTSDNGDSMDGVFEVAESNKVCYVVVKRTNFLGETNEDEIKYAAGCHDFSYIESAGEYLIFKSI